MSAEFLLEIERDLDRLSDRWDLDDFVAERLREIARKAGAEAERIKLANVKGQGA